MTINFVIAVFLILCGNFFMEIVDGKVLINGLEKIPSIISKAKYALGLKKEKPINQRKCSPEYWNEIVSEMGKYYKVPKDKIEKAKRSRIYLK
ncbi:hypothetical protein [Foetidibacter luteolus]|uniref:hypothetical protein n=2 Tax=Foetidibacter luteolus TaxID=2608880 RepID=UPI00129A65D4|nr:hypothetical protein [Foetidibacter luteolus]